MNYGGGGGAPNMMAGGGGVFGAAPMETMESSKNPLHMCYKLCENPNELNQDNILEKFSQCPSQFYDRQCDNELLAMQRQSLQSHLTNMTGIQYMVALANKPLFVIRKVKRNSPIPTDVTPLAEYYVINGVVYQSPDLASVVNSRLMHAINHVRVAFEQSYSCVKYNPSRGYSWSFQQPTASGDQSQSDKQRKARASTPPNQVRSTLYQRTRVDGLLAQLTKQFPPPEHNAAEPTPQALPDDDSQSTSGGTAGEPAAKRVKQD